MQLPIKAVCDDKMDTELLDSLGLGQMSLFTTQGAVCADNFSKVMEVFKTMGANNATMAQMASQLGLWGAIAPRASETIEKLYEDVYVAIETLAMSEDDDNSTGDSYAGKQTWAKSLTEMLNNCAMKDTTQMLAAKLSPRAYVAIDKIVHVEGIRFLETSPFQKECAASARSEVVINLLKSLPYSGSVCIPNAMAVIKHIINTESMPKNIKNQASTSIQTHANVNKQGLVNSGNEIMDLIKAGKSGLIMTFLTMPELYKNAPESVHNNMDVVVKLPYMQCVTLLYTVSQNDAGVVAPYTNVFIDKLVSDGAMGSVTLMIIKNIAIFQPNEVYPLLPDIQTKAAQVTNSDHVLMQIFGACSQATVPENAADLMLERIIDQMKRAKTPDCISVALVEISNMLPRLSSAAVIAPHLSFIQQHKGSSEIVVTNIEDFAAGRSLKGLTARVDEMEARIQAMNQRVSECCSNFEDVKRYVDDNIADLKDFVGEVAKKLPQPRRLEVVGTLRKTLILHFQCCQTGYEYPVTSADWSKWLKMGFSLVKAGQAVIDIGMGNPLGLLKKGIDCISEIYSAYKTNDDDEFNSYITNPFLTSSEQDMLLEKLRAQSFFDRFAYDAQAPGWYLLEPTKYGKLPEGEDGGVTKVRTKEGYGVMDTIKAAVSLAVENSDYADLVSAVTEGVELAASIAEDMQNIDDPILSPDAAKSQPPQATTTTVNKAKPTRNNRVAQDDRMPDPEYDRMIRDLELRVNTLETRIASLESSKSCCTIS